MTSDIKTLFLLIEEIEYFFKEKPTNLQYRKYAKVMREVNIELSRIYAEPATEEKEKFKIPPELENKRGSVVVSAEQSISNKNNENIENNT
jgi:hypothetical protein